MKNITPSSISKETKARFDLLLKNALNKSKKHLLPNDENKLSKENVSTAAENSDKKTKTDTNQQEKPFARIRNNAENSKSVVDKIHEKEIGINELLSDSNVLFDTFKKPPVPLPRSNKSRKSSATSEENITSLSPIKIPTTSRSKNEEFTNKLQNENNYKEKVTSNLCSPLSDKTFIFDDNSLSSHSDRTYTRKSPLEIEMEKLSNSSKEIDAHFNREENSSLPLKSANTTVMTSLGIGKTTPKSIENLPKQPEIKERKKWNKDDSVIFIKPQITYQNQHQHQIQAYNDTIDSMHLSNNEHVLSTPMSNKHLKNTHNIGDVIVHQSPSSSSSVSIQVFDDNYDLSNDDSEHENKHDYDDDNDVYQFNIDMSDDSIRKSKNKRHDSDKEFIIFKHKKDSYEISSNDLGESTQHKKFKSNYVRSNDKNNNESSESIQLIKSNYVISKESTEDINHQIVKEQKLFQHQKIKNHNVSSDDSNESTKIQHKSHDSAKKLKKDKILESNYVLSNYDSNDYDDDNDVCQIDIVNHHMSVKTYDESNKDDLETEKDNSKPTIIENKNKIRRKSNYYVENEITKNKQIKSTRKKENYEDVIVTSTYESDTNDEKNDTTISQTKSIRQRKIYDASTDDSNEPERKFEKISEQISDIKNVRQKIDSRRNSTKNQNEEILKYSTESEKSSSETNESDTSTDDESSTNDQATGSLTKEESLRMKSAENKRKIRKKTISKDKISKKFTYENIFGITIHKMDNIIVNSLTVHPLVKLHVIDLETGDYLKKSDPKRSVCFYYENDSVDYLIPILTHEFNFIEKRSFYPEWEETLILNEDFEYFIRNDKVVIFFEILDFVNYSVLQRNKDGITNGWYKIAWAFLKLVGKNNSLNVEKKLRLQLYKPNKNTRTLKKNSANGSSKHQCDIYKFWQKKSYEKYPGTLYVTCKRLIPNFSTPKVLRSQNPIESEYETTISMDPMSLRTQIQKQELIDTDNTGGGGDTNRHVDFSLESLKQWTRRGNQSCKIPNQLLHKLKPLGRGCFLLKFSNNGFHLACSTVDQNNLFNITIFQVITGEKQATLYGHNGLIYDLQWSYDDKYLLSASADCIVYIWNMTDLSKIPLYMLPHPAYVYCASFYPSEDKLIIVTGCYDNIVRVWCENIEKKKSPNVIPTFQLLDELENHNGYITTMCYDSTVENLYTGDSIGQIMCWTIGQECHFMLKREYKIRELRQKIINTLHCHPGGQRLLVHGRDGVLRMMDIVSGCVMQWFTSSPTNVQTRCCLSPCGSLVFGSNGDGLVNVWNADTGRQEAVYNLEEVFLTNKLIIHCIDYHPKDHIIALSHYGHFTPILVFEYNVHSSENIVKMLNKPIPSIVVADDDGDDNNKKFPEAVRHVIEQNPTRGNSRPTLDDIIVKIDNIILPTINKEIY